MRSDDARFMRAALALGRRTMGQAAPNPSVGALVVQGGVVVGRGVTAPGGRPHAESLALAEAGESARGATIYVTLEPCSHHGRTPPCVDAIVAAGVARAVVALRDPDPRVSGRGLARLREAGISVREDVESAEASRDHIGHLTRVTRGRPAVTLKTAESVDGFAASLPGQPRLLITGPLANAHVHRMRALHDAVMIGRGTADADDPLLTVRLPGLEPLSPLRVVLDRRASLSPTSRLAATAHDHPVLLLTAKGTDRARTGPLEAAGVDVCRIGQDSFTIDEALGELGRRGLTRVFCEGGPTLAASLIRGGLVDSVVRLTGPEPVGHGRAAFAPEALALLSDATTFFVQDDAMIGADRLRVYFKVDSACSPGL